VRLLILCIALAQSPPQASDSIVVTATPIVADSASGGTIPRDQIEVRAEQRPADVLESIPGLIVSQHSGEGKANQYYLRGFDLDHGTDFATSVDGVPVNMPTHAHGQGYTDLNFLIPELISGVDYTKGPYFADQGDFSSAGSASIGYASSLAQPIVSLTGGSFGYRRGLAAGSKSIGSAQLLGALEISRNNGPWVRPDDYRKFNALLRYSGGGNNSAWSLTAAAYDGRWNSTDQVPDRAFNEHLISRFGAIDPSDGGSSHRYALNGGWQRGGDDSLIKMNAYAIAYGLQLFSDFTYFLNDPVNGDQFEQADRRIVLGGETTRQWRSTLFGRSAENLIGFDIRHDHIGNIGLYHTRDREVLETIRQDKILQTSSGVFAQSAIQWTSRLRSVIGVRLDDDRFEGSNASIVSPKLSVNYGPLYLNAGGGFHSNDARDARTPLVRTRGVELGVRVGASTFSLWKLDMASELVFAGDTATTDASPASRRFGVEWSTQHHLSDHWILDADAAWSRGRFRGTGDRIPGSLEGVASSGISFYDIGRLSGSLRYRYLGPRPLNETDSVRSPASNLVTADIGCAITRRYRLVLEGLNLLNARVSDIDYYYASRLPGEPLGGVNDIHMHPVEPRAVRIRFEAAF
jgi:hypothetical protein